MQFTFPYNAVLVSMAYTDATEELTLVYRKDMKTKRYRNVPAAIAYGLFYKTTASDMLSFYAKNIRKKYSLIN